MESDSRRRHRAMIRNCIPLSCALMLLAGCVSTQPPNATRNPSMRLLVGTKDTLAQDTRVYFDKISKQYTIAPSSFDGESAIEFAKETTVVITEVMEQTTVRFDGTIVMRSYFPVVAIEHGEAKKIQCSVFFPALQLRGNTEHVEHYPKPR